MRGRAPAALLAVALALAACDHAPPGPLEKRARQYHVVGTVHVTGTRPVPSQRRFRPPPDMSAAHEIAFAAWAPDRHTVAIAQSPKVGHARIVLLDLATGRRTLINHPAFQRLPYGLTFSPDGRYLLVSRDDSLAAYDIQRRRETRLLEGHILPSEVSWSPDGRRIAFARAIYGRDGFLAGTGIGVLDLEDRSVHVLTYEGTSPAWSPDGTRIAFSSTRHTRGKQCGEEGCDPSPELDVMRADGSHRRRLTHTDAAEEFAAWSPDGRQLIVNVTYGDYTNPRFGLVAVAAGGSCYRKLIRPSGLELTLRERFLPPGVPPPGVRRGC